MVRRSILSVLLLIVTSSTDATYTDIESRQMDGIEQCEKSIEDYPYKYSSQAFGINVDIPENASLSLLKDFFGRKNVKVYDTTTLHLWASCHDIINFDQLHSQHRLRFKEIQPHAKLHQSVHNLKMLLSPVNDDDFPLDPDSDSGIFEAYEDEIDTKFSATSSDEKVQLHVTFGHLNTYEINALLKHKHIYQFANDADCSHLLLQRENTASFEDSLTLEVSTRLVAQVVTELSFMREVVWIEVRERFIMYNKWVKGVVESGGSFSEETFLDRAGFTGAGHVIGVSDTGTDKDEFLLCLNNTC